MSKKKRISKEFEPPQKSPRISQKNSDALENFRTLNPSWQLKSLDLDHDLWGWKKIKKFSDILEKLKNYETMTWGEILSNKKYNHNVLKDQLDKRAQKRLEDLKLDDISELFRLRLGGKERVWGILDRYILKIIWWDPEHTVCPSEKKHT